MFYLNIIRVTTVLAFISCLSQWKLISYCDAQDPDCDKHQQTSSEIGVWLNSSLIQLETMYSKYMNSMYEQAININDENSKKATEMEANLNNNKLKMGNEANEYLNKNEWLSQCQKELKRMLDHIAMDANLILKDEEKRMMEIELKSSLGKHYSQSSVEKDGKTYRLQPDLTDIMSKSRNPEELLWAWEGWHNQAAQSRDNFQEMIKLMNEAAIEHGFKDAGEVWRLKDVEDLNAAKNMVKMMEDFQPLYKNIHAYVRAKLGQQERYKDIIDPNGPIPAHLLGDMWAQQWYTLEDILIPYPDAPPPPNITDALLKNEYTVEKMFKLAEEFFVSLGFQRMTDIFWEKSVIRRPDDPNIKMDCHPIAYNMFAKNDYRIKMCSQIDDRNLEIIHHEMGHIVYYMEYSNQPTIFRDGAIPSFHEAVGDTIGLSVTSQKHLETIGLIDKNNFPSTKETYQTCDDRCKIKINALMRKALEKVVFLPFALSLELWRYGVFNGSITPGEYNSKWWEIREKYQGIKPLVERDSKKFDPGAKYHVATNYQYSRYFYSFIAQFQFHDALCKLAGDDKELSNCDIYNSKTAGEKFRSMLAKGSSRPWRELMKDLTGTEEFSTKPMVNYFKPLHDWLLKKNKELNIEIGWEK